MFSQGSSQFGPSARAAVLSDSMNEEYQVRLNHLRVSIEHTELADEVGEYTVGRLVRVDGRDAGIVTRMEAGSRPVVLTTDGLRQTCLFSQLQPVDLPPKQRYIPDMDIGQEGPA